MPVLGSTPVLPPPAPPEVTPVPRSRMLRYTLSTDFDSLDLVLANGVHVGSGVRGLDMPDVEHNEDEPIDYDGGISYPSLFGFREVFLPLECRSPDGTQDGLQLLVDRITQMLNARRTAVRVTVAHHDGRRRWIEGRYEGGFDGDMVFGAGMWRQPMPITIRCDDPYWKGDEQRIVFAKGNAATKPFLGTGFLPLRLNESVKLGEIEIDVLGNAEAFPVWRVHGPGSSFTATDLTTGEGWELGALAEDDEVILNARRGVQTIKKNDVNAWNLPVPGSALWPLQPGKSTVELAIEEIDTDSAIELTYIPRYLTVWNR